MNLVGRLGVCVVLNVGLQATAQSQATSQTLSSADREDMIRIPMRDGTHLMATLLFPKNQPRQNRATVLIHTPHSIDSVLSTVAPYVRSFLAHGYVTLIENSRGRYFSEGTYTFLGGSGEDGYDAIAWISKQPWSNGKVGTFGCSSGAEEQHKINASHPPGLAAAVLMGSGAGIGRVGPYHEMGNFYRGGVIQNFWFLWYYLAGYRNRPAFAADLSREELLRLARFWSLEPDRMPPEPEIEGRFNRLVWTLPLDQIPRRLGAPPSDLDDFVKRLPNAPQWDLVEFGNEGDRVGAPTLYVNSWYDLSIGPNTAMFEYQTKHAATETARNNIFMVIAPSLHCRMGTGESAHTVVGERDLGDARFDYVSLVQRWFDHWMMGVQNGAADQPKVRAYLMGANRWQSYKTWPPQDAHPLVYYLDSEGAANSKNGNGRLSTAPPRRHGCDAFTYDPLNPVTTPGGIVATIMAGATDQSDVESRADVLVYTSKPLRHPMEVTGPVKVGLYLSSDVKDTDLFVTLVDVYPDGRAFKLDQGVMRVRWRKGYDEPVFMRPGEVYKVEFPPLVTSNTFAAGHRVRLEVTSSSFPQFERNLNTGGGNADEVDPVTAHNVIHHAPDYPSWLQLPVLSAGR